MKMLFGILLLSFGVASTGFAQSDSHQKSENFVVGTTQNNLVLRFFAHLGPNIREYTEGKTRVKAIVAKIIAAGFQPSQEQIQIGISPKAMAGGKIVFEETSIYIAITATDDEIESAMLDFFVISVTSGKITYFAHNGPTIEEFHAGKAKVEGVLALFAQQNIPLVFPENFRIGITASSMAGGNIVEQNDGLYISTKATEEDLERHFTQYIQE